MRGYGEENGRGSGRKAEGYAGESGGICRGKRGKMQGKAGGNGEEKESFFARCCIIQEIKLPLPRFSEEKTGGSGEEDGGIRRRRRGDWKEKKGGMEGEDGGLERIRRIHKTNTKYI